MVVTVGGVQDNLGIYLTPYGRSREEIREEGIWVHVLPLEEGHPHLPNLEHGSNVVVHCVVINSSPPLCMRYYSLGTTRMTAYSSPKSKSLWEGLRVALREIGEICLRVSNGVENS